MSEIAYLPAMEWALFNQSISISYQFCDPFWHKTDISSCSTDDMYTETKLRTLRVSLDPRLVPLIVLGEKKKHVTCNSYTSTVIYDLTTTHEF